MSLKVCIVGANASLKYGGEASLPWLCFKFLRQRGIDAHLVAHGRTRPEVIAGFPNDLDRLHFVPETRIDYWLWKLGQYVPSKLNSQTLVILRYVMAQLEQRKIVKRLIRSQGIQIVHEINPVSPKQVSAMFDLGVPVVIGPLAGGMLYPPAFAYMESRATRAVEAFGRATSHLLNRLLPGKLQADAIIIANEQARRALPHGVRGDLYEMPDVGVDLSVWNDGDAAGDASSDANVAHSTDAVRFVYLGRLADWKGVQFLLEAFPRVLAAAPGATLDILGDGEDRKQLEAQVNRLGLTQRVTFAGWIAASEGARRMRSADALVLPSLHECGGIVLIEAMAVGVPVIATRWGGPAAHVTDATGIRVSPDTREGFIQGLADAMIRIAQSPDLRRRMGAAGKAHVRQGLYDWNRKTDFLLKLYEKLVS